MAEARSPRRVDVDYTRPAASDGQASALHKLLREYGPPDKGHDGAFELRVPNEHLQIVVSQAEALTGAKAPRQPRARREWLAALVAPA